MRVRNKKTGLEWIVEDENILRCLNDPNYEVLEISEEEKSLMKQGAQLPTAEEILLGDVNYCKHVNNKGKQCKNPAQQGDLCNYHFNLKQP